MQISSFLPLSSSRKMKSIVLIFLFINLFALTSCEREYCWDCTYYSQVGGVVGSLRETKQVVCEKTESEIRDMEKAGTSMQTISGGNLLKTDVVCKKQN
jgi:hypothetical protein